jgi:hypothetical protein
MAKNVKLPVIVGLAVAGIVACSVFIYFQIVRGMAPDKPTALLPPPVEQPPLIAPEPEIEIPPLDASDEVVRSLAETVSEHPRLARWLAPDDLVRRFVAAVDNVANDESPRPHIRHLKPEGAFSVEERAGALAIAPDSYARYNRFVAVLDSLDDQACIELYHRLKPLFDEAYQDLGYPAGDFDVALADAVDRLLETPIPQGDVRVKQRVSTFRFADPDLEELGPAEKHLIRMGPANARKVKAKLRLLRASLP